MIFLVIEGRAAVGGGMERHETECSGGKRGGKTNETSARTGVTLDCGATFTTEGC